MPLSFRALSHHWRQGWYGILLHSTYPTCILCLSLTWPLHRTCLFTPLFSILSYSGQEHHRDARSGHALSRWPGGEDRCVGMSNHMRIVTHRVSVLTSTPSPHSVPIFSSCPVTRQKPLHSLSMRHVWSSVAFIASLPYRLIFPWNSG